MASGGIIKHYRKAKITNNGFSLCIDQHVCLKVSSGQIKYTCDTWTRIQRTPLRSPCMMGGSCSCRYCKPSATSAHCENKTGKRSSYTLKHIVIHVREPLDWRLHFSSDSSKHCRWDTTLTRIRALRVLEYGLVTRPRSRDLIRSIYAFLPSDASGMHCERNILQDK